MYASILRVCTLWLTAACTLLHADYSPFQVGRTWEYRGKGANVDPADSKTVMYAGVIRYEETLRLKVVDIVTRGDSTRILVEERDSLYARTVAEWRGPGAPPAQPMRDTVCVRTLTYVQKQGILRLQGGDGLALGHRDSGDVFFPTASAAPGRPWSTALPGLEGNHRGVEVSGYYLRTGSLMGVASVAWYVDGIGLYWMRLRTHFATCDFPEARELILVSMDGNPVDIGRDPSGMALAKDARVACALRRPAASPGLFRLQGRQADLLGRNSGPKAR